MELFLRLRVNSLGLFLSHDWRWLLLFDLLDVLVIPEPCHGGVWSSRNVGVQSDLLAFLEAQAERNT